MRSGRLLPLAVVLTNVLVALSPAMSSTPAESDPAQAPTPPPKVRRARMGYVALDPAPPPDLIDPEGRTRWDLGRVRIVSSRVVETRVTMADAPLTVVEETAGTGRPSVRSLVDPAGGVAAKSWLFPDEDRDALRLGERRTLDLEETVGQEGASDRLRIEIETVGVGWLHLPSGPRETALQRVLVLRRRANGRGFEPDVLRHRWVDPLAGVVAEVEGPASEDGRSSISVTRASILQELLSPAATLKLHVSEVDTPVLGVINYGFDRGPNTPVSSLTPAAPANLGALIAASSWDFSGTTIATTTLMAGTTTANNSTTITGTGTTFTTDLAVGDRISLSSAPGTFAIVTVVTDDTHATVATPLGNGSTQTINRRVRESASITTPITTCETCNTASCGYNVAGSQLDRRDSNFDAGTIPISGTTTANASTTITGSGTSFTSQLTKGDAISLSSNPNAFARVTAITNNTTLTVCSPLGNGTTQSINRRLLIRNNTVSQRQDRASDAVIWLRAGSQKEGKTGSFGQGESRFCYSPFDDNGDGTIQTAENRTLVPEWQFTHNDSDGKGYYFQAGDSAVGGPFNCEQNLYNQLCGAGQIFDKLYAKACTGSDGSNHTGTQRVDIVKNGVITLPSGHTFNALLARNLTDFCVYIGSSCSSFAKVDEVRTVNYLWQVPVLGTLVRVQGPQNAVLNYDTTTMLVETDINFGLFPPRSITAPSSTNTTVSLSWDPGLDTRRISGYKVYWDTDSGGSSSYAFNSVTNAGQASIVGTMATISGLTAGTTYYFTVTSRSTYTDPSTSVMTTYESIVYPTQVFGDPSFAYPIEVQKATTGGSCVPTATVSGVTVVKSGANVQICWNPVSDPCLIGYRLLAASSPTVDTNFSTLADVGLTTCFTGSPGVGSRRYFLVVARGTGGTGPWGAYGH